MDSNSYDAPKTPKKPPPPQGAGAAVAFRYLVLLALSLLLAVVGYFLFGIVVAIHAGLLLQGEKMYYAQGLPAHLFGATGAALGVVVSWILWRLGIAACGTPKSGD